MKIKRLLKCLAIITVIILLFQQTAFAQTEEVKVRPPKPTIGRESPDPNYATGNSSLSFSIQALGLMKNVACSIAPSESSGVISVDGHGFAFETCNEMKIQLHIQQWTGSEWKNVLSYYSSDYNTHFIMRATNKDCPKGYYYRGYCVVTAIAYSGARDSLSVTTDYIYYE